IVKIGGILLPLFSGYGASAIRTRLNDAGAKAVFTADGFFRRGKLVAMKQILDDALQGAPDVKHVIVARRAGQSPLPMTDNRDFWWHELVPGGPAEAE